VTWVHLRSVHSGPSGAYNVDGPLYSVRSDDVTSLREMVSKGVVAVTLRGGQEFMVAGTLDAVEGLLAPPEIPNRGFKA